MHFVDRLFIPLYDMVHDVTIGIIEAVPEEKLESRPYATAKTIREHIVHIASVERAFALGAAGHGWEFEETGYDPADFQGRTALWNLVLQTRDEVVSLARSISAHRLNERASTPWGFEASPAQLLLMLRDHTNNHNGKLSICLRIEEIEPPFFVALGIDTFQDLLPDV
jgi:uncharacterized damage-inducible protein DinB